jgi:phosphinothricin acetyltransferase
LIRLATPADAAQLAEIYRPVVLGTVISFEVVPPSVVEMERRVRTTLATHPWLVLERKGEIAGYACASRHRERAAYQWSVDVSVYVGEAHRRSGAGSALYRSLFEALRLQGFYTAHAGITLPNAASVALHESLGFVPVGIYRSVGFKLGAWHDTGWWQLPLRAREGTPAPPRALSDACADPRWAAAMAAGASQRAQGA